MKRKQHENLIKSEWNPRAIRADRLALVRGGGQLGITVESRRRSSDGMEHQHNEILVRL